MAGERRQTARRGQTPERVQQAAQAMQYSAPSGYQRGYVPQNTGGYPSQGTGGMGRQNPGRHGPQNTGGYPPQGAGGMYTGNQQGFRQTGFTRQSAASQNTGGMQFVSSMGGGTRGFTVPPASGGEKPGNPRRRRTALILSLVAVSLAAICGAGLGIKYLIDKNQDEERIRAREKQRAAVQRELNQYENLFLPGVYVDNIPLGGMTPEQARNEVTSQIQRALDEWNVTLTYQGMNVITIRPGDLGMASNPEEVLAEAWKQGHTGTQEDQYQAMLRLREEPYYAYTARPSGNTAYIDSVLAEIKRQLDRPAVNATVSEFQAGLAEPFTFTDEVYGMNLDTEPLKQRLYEMVSTLETGTVEIVPEMIQPAVTRAELERQYAVRASVYTRIDKHSPDNRNDNIRIAFSKINGYVLQPGKTFSFNKVVGNRSTKNGFKTAIEYVYGEHVEGIGGGVCQASTTVFQAAICAGLKVTERYAHSDSVSYAEYGMDATVSDTKGHEKNLKFVNTSDYPIYIKAEVTEDPSNKKLLIAKVTLYGEDLGDTKYELVSELSETILPPIEPQYIKDRNREYVTYTDEQKKVADAKEGYVYKSYRVTYVNKQETAREYLYTDTYNPKPEKIYVGVSKRE